MDSRSGIIIVMVRGPHDLKYNVLTYSYLSKLWRIVTTADYTNWACWLILAFSKLTALIWILEHCRGDSPKLGLLNGKILWLDLNTSQPYFAMLLLKWFVISRTIQHKKNFKGKRKTTNSFDFLLLLLFPIWKEHNFFLIWEDFLTLDMENL